LAATGRRPTSDGEGRFVFRGNRPLR